MSPLSLYSGAIVGDDNDKWLGVFIYMLLFLTSLNSYYWAPWMASLLIAEGEEHKLPYEIVFSSFIVASMLGNYLFQMFSVPSAVSGSAAPNIGGAFQVDSHTQ